MKRVLEAICLVESSGKGFSPTTGKLKIQFEPHLFAKSTLRARSASTIWGSNKVDVQSKEWEAFNDALAIDADKAIEATSMGKPQILGLHWKRLGYSSPAGMFHYFNRSEDYQLEGLEEFVKTDRVLHEAVKALDWHRIALCYNGRRYKEMAIKHGWKPYNEKLKATYESLG